MIGSLNLAKLDVCGYSYKAKTRIAIAIRTNRRESHLLIIACLACCFSLLWNASLASSGSELLVLDFNFIICTTINIFYEGGVN